jgi:uncharacterized membrane protein YjjP (DUF1212 family)
MTVFQNITIRSILFMVWLFGQNRTTSILFFNLKTISTMQFYVSKQINVNCSIFHVELHQQGAKVK